MGRISYEDKMRIQTPHEQGLGAKAIRSRYPAKQWGLHVQSSEFKHSEDDLSPHYQDGICCDSSVWQRTAKISSNCAEHCCSRRHDLLSTGPARYEQKFLSDCQNAWNERQIRSAHRENGSRVVSFSAQFASRFPPAIAKVRHS